MPRSTDRRGRTSPKRKPKRPTEPSELQLAECVWEDAEEIGEVGWNDLEELFELAEEPCPVMHTVGYIIYESNEHISMVSTIGPDECSRIEKIPRSFIKSLTYLERPE
jgi:hypothetical protein